MMINLKSGTKTRRLSLLSYNKGAAQQVVTSGALPPVVIEMVPYRMKFAEKTSRLMSPFSKDETGHES